MSLEEKISYYIGFIMSILSYICDFLPHSLKGWTEFFALLIVITTYFGITLPRVLQNKNIFKTKKKSMLIKKVSLNKRKKIKRK